MTDELFTYEMYESVRDKLKNTVMNNLTNEDKSFLISFTKGIPDWNTWDYSRYPGVQWKLMNINKLKEINLRKSQEQINRLENLFSCKQPWTILNHIEPIPARLSVSWRNNHDNLCPPTSSDVAGYVGRSPKPQEGLSAGRRWTGNFFRRILCHPRPSDPVQLYRDPFGKPIQAEGRHYYIHYHWLSGFVCSRLMKLKVCDWILSLFNLLMFLNKALGTMSYIAYYLLKFQLIIFSNNSLK